jgi:hypothetical protein
MAMLHFCKTPYLHYNPVEERDEVMDPLQIQFTRECTATPPTDATLKEVVDEMLRYIPDLRLKHAVAQRKVEKEIDDKAVEKLRGDYALLRQQYPEYLFRKEQSRRFVVDTNSLVMDIVAGGGSALEQFKRVHRGIDALKALEERDRLANENARRVALINNSDFGDPDVDRVVIVDSDSTGAANLVGGAATASTAAPSPTPTSGSR